MSKFTTILLNAIAVFVASVVAVMGPRWGLVHNTSDVRKRQGFVRNQ
jgi:hypothetical protein